MAKYIGPKCKICRRAGEKLFLKGERCFTAKCAMVKRNFPPGQHAQKGYGRLTEFGMQLKEKQKAKKTYGLMEKQFHSYYLKARRQTGDITENILRFLELRLDNVVYRANFAPSRSKARQIVGHGHILVNQKKVNIPSYQLKKGDVVSFSATSMKKKDAQEILKTIAKKNPPRWLKVDPQQLICGIIAVPTSELVQPNFALHQIVEFYSR